MDRVSQAGPPPPSSAGDAFSTVGCSFNDDSGEVVGLRRAGSKKFYGAAKLLQNLVGRSRGVLCDYLTNTLLLHFIAFQILEFVKAIA